MQVSCITKGGKSVILTKDVRARMFFLIICLTCFDPSVLFCCLVISFCFAICSVSSDRPKRSQAIRMEVPCISVP